MDEKESHVSDSVDTEEALPEPLELEGEATETIDLQGLFTRDVTASGSFDIRGGIWATTFGKVMQALPIPALLINDRYQTVVANQACGKISPEYEDILETEFPRLFPDPVGARKARRVLEHVFESRVSKIIEDFLRIGERGIWARTSFRSIRVGRDRYILVLVEDLSAEKKRVSLEQRHNRLLREEISRRKEAEDALRKSEVQYRELAELLPLIVFETDRAGNFIFINCNALGCLGFERDEFYKTLNIARLIVPRDREAPPQAVLKELISRNPEGYRCSMLRKNGTAVPMEIYAAGIVHDGELVGLRGVAVDVTERNKRDDALRESEERFRTLVETMNEGLAVVDEQGNVTYVNQRYAEMLGCTRDEIMYGSEKGFKASGNLDSLWNKWRERQPGDSRTFQTVLTRKDGSEVPVIVARKSIRDSDGHCKGSFGVFTDISRMKAAEERIRADLEEKEVMLREIHHRVKNNLQVMSSLVELQSFYVKKKNTEQVILDLISRIQAMGLVHEHLHRSERVDSISVHEYINKVAESVFECYHMVPGRVDLQIHVDPNTYWTIDTATPCGLILNELISNSLKHAFPQGRSGVIEVLVHVSADEEHVITVRDNGVGLPDDIDVADPSTFGFDIVKTLVDQIFGTIEVRHVPGAEFSIRFKEKKRKRAQA